jgi:phage shock protein C
MKKLYLSRTDKKIMGVCGGIAELLEVDSTIVRLITVFICLITGIFPVLIMYILAAMIIPNKPEGQ